MLGVALFFISQRYRAARRSGHTDVDAAVRELENVVKIKVRVS
jgi:hypothetical protein